MKELILLIVFFFVGSIPVLSQNQNAIDSLQQVILETKNTTVKMKAYRELFSMVYDRDMERADRIIDSMELASEHDDFVGLGHLNQVKAVFFARNSELDSSEYYFKQAVSWFDKGGDLENKSGSLGSLGNNYRRKGDFENAAASTIHALRLKDTLGLEEIFKAKDYLSLGNINSEVRNFQASNEYFFNAISIYEAEGNQQFVAHLNTNIGMNYNHLKDFDRAEEYLLKAIAFYEENNLDYYLMSAYNALANVYKNTDKTVLAIEYFKQVLSLSEQLNATELKAIATLNLGVMSQKTGNYRQAESYLLEALELNKETGSLYTLSSNYDILANVYTDLNDFENAYQYSRLYQNLNDSISGIETKAAIKELEKKYETERKEAELALQEEEIKNLNQEIEISNLNKTLYGIGLISMISIAGLILLVYRQRIKRNRLAYEKQQAIYKQELDFKQRELASQTLQILQKNTFINEFDQRIHHVVKNPEATEKELRRLKQLIKTHMAEEKDWEVFKTYFTEVHQDFEQNLKNKAPTVTEKEVRLASFLRMNLNTKEIATILNVLPDTILKSKYRLKKKLQLPSEEDLISFIKSV
ncbi:tetratricopeptide repeat protein [Planktosalinus lacus]|uniref:tetratricopeptide repeat protein n=1 Tax=Planktosalinus lacus TaxID=1526573 RepID=UPI00166C3575|nr:tetratricopeptide repeat protein [Planktosalinus lacus]